MKNIRLTNLTHKHKLIRWFWYYSFLQNPRISVNILNKLETYWINRETLSNSTTETWISVLKQNRSKNQGIHNPFNTILRRCHRCSHFHTVTLSIKATKILFSWFRLCLYVRLSWYYTSQFTFYWLHEGHYNLLYLRNNQMQNVLECWWLLSANVKKRIQWFSQFKHS